MHPRFATDWPATARRKGANAPTATLCETKFGSGTTNFAHINMSICFPAGHPPPGHHRGTADGTGPGENTYVRTPPLGGKGVWERAVGKQGSAGRRIAQGKTGGENERAGTYVGRSGGRTYVQRGLERLRGQRSAVLAKLSGYRSSSGPPARKNPHTKSRPAEACPSVWGVRGLWAAGRPPRRHPYEYARVLRGGVHKHT